MKATLLINLLGVAMSMAAVNASAQVLSGYFDNPANTALVASDLGAASFADTLAISNNVALYELSVPVAGIVTITSTGFAAGGADPYFSLFAGSGVSASFIASNYDQAFSTGGDFGYTGTLAAGAYRLAIGVFANLSFAENLGSGSLADGFTALGTPGSLGNASYRVVVAVAVPEVSSWALLLAGLLAVGWATHAKSLLNSRSASGGGANTLAAGLHSAQPMNEATGHAGLQDHCDVRPIQNRVGKC